MKNPLAVKSKMFNKWRAKSVSVWFPGSDWCPVLINFSNATSCSKKSRRSIPGKVFNVNTDLVITKLDSHAFSKFLMVREESSPCILNYRAFQDFDRLIRNRKHKFILFTLKLVYTIDPINYFSQLLSVTL